jgi:hypothetical protein
VLSIDDNALRQDVVAFLRSPSGQRVLEDLHIPLWLCAAGAIILGCAGMCMLPTIIWTLTGVRALLSLVRLVQSTGGNPQEHPEKLVPLIGYVAVVGPDQQHALVLATFGAQSLSDPALLASKANQIAKIYGWCKSSTSIAADEPLCTLLRDDTFQPRRRRRLPELWAEHAELWLLDVKLDPQEVFIWEEQNVVLAALVAEPEDRGGVAHIPWSVVQNAVST